MELAEHKITVNAYAPGIVGTAMWELIDEKLAEINGTEKGSMVKKYTKELTALGRTSVPEDVSGLVSFLAGKDSDFITGDLIYGYANAYCTDNGEGQTQVVDGGIIYT